MSHDPPSTVTILTDSFEPPERIGPYRLLDRKPIGAGGMGEVYLAEQDTPRRRVALKIIKLGMDTRQVIARFEQEREALGLMEHPNVARIYDAGSTPEGRPYFVMEYVRGVPITKHCDEQRLTIRQRIELFLAVCDGIQHAHQKAIIHRDVTPRNVLVEFADGRATPKVIDFGLAKALGARLTDRTLSREGGGFVGTLPYSSPEQAGGNRDIDTRTDIYSLGALLYELLAGVPPIDFEWASPLEDCLRRIREAEPLPPSVRVGQGSVGVPPADPSRASDPSRARKEAVSQPSAQQPAATSAVITFSHSHINTLAHTRRTDPRGLVRELRNEPDWIVMKCLEKERARRYESLLGQEHPDVAQSLNNLASLYQVRGDYSAAEPVLREALAMKRKLLGDEHPGVAAGLNNLAVVLASKGDFAAAEPLYREALAIKRKTLGDEHPDVAAGLNNLAALLQAEGDYTAAESLFRQALALCREVLGESHPNVASSMNNLAHLLHRRHDYSAAEELYRGALAKYRQSLGDEHPHVASTLNNLAGLLQETGNYAAAEPFYRESLTIRRKRLGNEHPEVANSLSNLASLLYRSGKYAAAEPLYREALDLCRRILPLGHLQTLYPQVGLGGTLTKLGQFAEAEGMLLEVANTCERVPNAKRMLWASVLRAMYDLYSAWHAAEPEKGYDGKAADWRAKLEEWRASTQPATTQSTATQPTTRASATP
ncbi:MAG: Serine/threonine-protein kinase PknD [Phycisphaerae bacterium]|nr:Serine/threonine-protein kinase PknD [Phycisphaerae bacterium]